jgi:hypothetical protein
MTGAGNSGFVYKLDAAQTLAAQGFFTSTNRVGLSASATNATGGPETFFIAETLHPVPEPDEELGSSSSSAIHVL